ncbi:flavin-containing monooxygenase [Aspergillus brunneoviolaceus CBS 621.78]|uniref:Cyclohexanone monooxygenase n=1 Tax=Aspergillus brunneoviolaceus CBS 621.78 TaxID=1450534 RepID=A0ACD1FVT1_9EURO|nr:cyclohexanone monooxygenase [Aspergillus brunneoviolaceus CBS 621.78]RAH41072.1 cyclohexanone monooxygenase [Aspergillus brunneoviolaceus CBS 621.78]
MGSISTTARPERAHSEPRRLRIVHVGAGAAGLMTAYKAQKMLSNYELAVYEKNTEVGGTWFENRYPGVGCDVPSHSYAFTFEPNSEWSGYYPRGEEIQKYMVDFAKKHSLYQYISFQTEVTQARWIEEDGEWQLDLKTKDGTRSQDRCHVLINGSGPLNKWKWPDIPGIDTYRGILTHPANWDPSIDWKGKRVAVIGTGSTGIQLIPQIVKDAKSLSVFVRSTQWIVPPAAWQDLRLFPDDPEKSAMPAPVGKHLYTEAEKEVFRTDPARFLQYRKAVDGVMQERFPIFLRHHPLHDMTTEMITQMVQSRVGPDREDIAKLFTPTFSPGCRRPTPGDGFLESLTMDNVRVVTDPIEQFTEKGIQTTGNEEREFDLIICATGFDVAFAPHFPVVGSQGQTMRDEWAKSPNIYLSMATPNFPNFFFIGGPTGNWAQGSVLITHEAQVEYALQCAAKISNEGLHSLTPKQAVTTQWRRHVDTWHDTHSVWAESCQSWMKYNGRIQLWPGSMLHMLKSLKSPRFEDYDIKYCEQNMWAYLGEGRTVTELRREKGEAVDMAPFMRTHDEPWSVE